MNVWRGRHTPDLAEAWERFKSSCGPELKTWVEAERALAAARGSGAADTEEGDRLLAAEAALQAAIMDFAASEDRERDPTRTALGLLRLAEQLLEEGSQADQDSRRRQRRSGADRRGAKRPPGSSAGAGDPQPPSRP